MQSKKIFGTFLGVLEILVLAAILATAFVVSGKQAERMQLHEAALCGPELLSQARPSEQAVFLTMSADKTEEKRKETLGQTGVQNSGEMYERVYDEAVFLEGAYVSDTAGKQLAKMAKEDERVAQILADAEDYPQELLEMLSKYPETIEFVADYHDKKDVPVPGTVGFVQKGEIPLLLQWDKRWGYSSYGDFMIANCGCGPTSLAMVVVGLTGDNSITPKRVSDFAQAQGYYEPGVGSKWTLMSEGARSFGVAGTELALCKSVVFENLEAGRPIICSVGPGDFTTNGHFIVLTKIEDGKIRVNDPNSCVNSGKLWEYEELEPQISNLWAFEVI